MGKAWKDVDWDMERQVAMGNRERIVIGVDFNAIIGRGGERRGVCGKYGLPAKLGGGWGRHGKM